MPAVKTLKQMRDEIATTVRDTQIGSLIDSFLNLTQQEIWDYHPWTFARRKTTLATVTSQEDYALDEEIDRLVVIRQRTSPQKLIYMPDALFYKLVPNVEDLATGIPRYYRLWAEDAFSTNLAASDTIYIASSSTSDGSSFKVTVVGRDTNGLVVSEVITLNGTTAVTSSTTFQASGLLQVSKSAKTTGTITVYRTTGATVLSQIAPEDITPRYKKISFYPVPSSAITLYLEYIERLRVMENDSDVPQLDVKWIPVLLHGAYAKSWFYKQNETAAQLMQRLYEEGVQRMQQQDLVNLDYVPVLERRPAWSNAPVLRRLADSISDNLPQYAVG